MTFEQIQRKAIAEWESLNKSGNPRIYIGTATCGRSSGALSVLDHLTDVLQQKKIDAHVIEVGCLGFCDLEPLIVIVKYQRPSIFYNRVTPEIVSQLVTDYLEKDNLRPDLAFCCMGKGNIPDIPNLFELPRFKPQVRIALRNCGFIDPGNINHSIAGEGYEGLFKALHITPEQVIEEVSKSGLRGRGWEGFPTGEKWRSCREARAEEKYMICNAAEGGPGALTARVLLESDPHSVLEGMLIGAYAIGATHGFIYVNAGYSLAVSRIKTALRQMEDCGLLGDDILGSHFSFDIEVKEGGGALVCGEETAMISALEGNRPIPYARSPFSGASGLQGKPTNINHAETFAHVSAILQKGPAWYASCGTERSKGTKIFALAGNITRPGLIEVPLGTTLRRIIFDAGRGIPDGKDFKAVQTGGPTGGWLSADDLDIPIDYESLTAAGSMIGSGSIIVADSETCAVDLARHSLSFIQTESCGKCVFCREGTIQMAEILTEISEGRGRPQDIGLLLKLGEGLKSGSLCALGRTAPNPALTTIKHFLGEYETHIKDKRCPAGVCRKLEPSAENKI